MLSDGDQHRMWAEETISDCLDRHEYAPIIFVGSGLSRRYLDAPNWRGLLSDLTEMCPKIEKPIEYFEEEYSEPEIASEFVKPFRKWAWEDYGEFDHFPESLFNDETGESNKPEKYLKHKVKEYFEELSPGSEDDLPSEYQEEIKKLRQIAPSAVVTTNYDLLLEQIFQGFETMVGQEIYHRENKIVGDLFKVHGCVSDKSSLVLTQEDYVYFEEEKKYISAKLLTYFTEHPVLILGHSASDENIKRLLSELDRMIPTEDNDLIDNLFLVDYKDDPSVLEGDPNLSRDELIDVGKERTVRVNAIRAHSFDWIFEAFGEDEAMDKAQVEQIREFRNRIYDVTTGDAPRKKVNFERLEYFSDEENIEKLLGFVPVDNPETVEGLRKAGIPIGEGEVSTEPVDDINSRLNTATQNYRSNGTLIRTKGTILEFRKRRDDLELTPKKCELLLRSSMNEGLQGADWLVKYPEDLLEELESLIYEDGTDARLIQRLEVTLLVLGQPDLLKQVYENHPDNGFLNGGLVEFCTKPVVERLDEYGASSNILFTGDDVSVTELYNSGDLDRVNYLLDTCGDILIEGEESADYSSTTTATDFRKLELIKIALAME